MIPREKNLSQPRAGEGSESLRKTEEFRTWFFLTVVMAPVLAVLTVSAYGLFVWMYQLLAGPPGA